MFTAKDLQDVSPYNWGVLMPYKGNTDCLVTVGFISINGKIMM